MTSRNMVSLVTRRATARVCSTTTAWLTVVSPSTRRPSLRRSCDTLRPTSTATPNSTRAMTSGQRGRRGVLSSTAHRGFDLVWLARRAAQPFDTARSDGVVILDPDPDVAVALDGGSDVRDHRAVLRRVGQDVEQAAADVDAGLDREHLALLKLGGSIRDRRRIVHLQPDPVTEAVRHVEKSLGAAHRLARTLVSPRRIERGVHALDQAEPRDAARQDRACRVGPRRGRRPRPDDAFRRGLRIADDLVYGALLRRERATHRQCAGDVGRVALVAGADVDHHDVTRFHAA